MTNVRNIKYTANPKCIDMILSHQSTPFSPQLYRESFQLEWENHFNFNVAFSTPQAMLSWAGLESPNQIFARYRSPSGHTALGLSAAAMGFHLSTKGLDHPMLWLWYQVCTRPHSSWLRNNLKRTIRTLSAKRIVEGRLSCSKLRI